MKSIKKAATGILVAAIAGGGLLFGAASASAATPAFEPDPNSEGSITFYDASGNVVTSGNDLSHLFDYAVASTPATRSTTKATLFFAFPDHTKPDSSTWFKSTAMTSSTYPNLSAPAPINTFTTPTAAASPGDVNLSALLSTTTLDTTPGYVNIVQLQLKDSGAGIGNGFLASPFWSADIQFDATAGTWTQVYPAPAAAASTSTVLTALPAATAHVGDSVGLTATVTPSGAAGSVQFSDGGAAIGSPVTVSGGKATISTTTLTKGSHTLKATFTPANPGAYAASTSAGLTYTITQPITSTSTSLVVTPTSPITVGPTSTLTATVTPAAATGTVQFKDGGTPLGSPVTVSGGTASATATFGVNTHSLTAVFTPTDPATYAASTSAAVSYVVQPAPAQTTTTTLAVAETSPRTYGTALHLTGTVAPAAAGTIVFLDGATQIGSGTVSGGTATVTVTNLAAGAHSLTAKFNPADPAAFGTSSSTPALAFTIDQAATSTALAVTPASPVVQGAPVTLKATVAPSSVAGKVQFADGGTALGGAVTVVGGVASLATSTLAAATHSLTATFTPTSGNYAGSASEAVSYVVTPPPPAASTTSLSVTPSPAVVGHDIALTAKVTPSAATGSVQFYDGTAPLGTPVALTAGLAKYTVTGGLALGAHSLRAAFTATDATKYNRSQGVATLQVIPPPAATTTALSVTPAGPVDHGAPVTLQATVTSTPAAVGTVQFRDDSTVLGSATVGAGGTATYVTTALSSGVHSLTARFLPTDATAFTSSDSPPSSLSVNAQGTTTSLAVAPAGPVTVGRAVTLTASLTPSTATGSVTFFDGTGSLGSAKLSAGKAVLTTTKLAQGTRSLTAAFVPASTVTFTASTSAAVTLQVEAAPTVGTVRSGGRAFAPGDELTPGTAVTLSAGGFQPNERVTLYVHSAPIKLGTATASSTGQVTVTVTLPSTLESGTHSLSIVGSIGTASFAFTVAGPAPSTGPGSSGSTTSSAGGAGSASGHSGGGLATTGADILAFVLAALTLLAAGAGTLLVARRRRGAHAA